MSQTQLLLTGAAGFVGERIAHRVALGEDDLDLRALVHTPSGPAAMRLARLPIDIEVGSILDGELMTELLSDCDAVIHCAFSMGNTSSEGTETILSAAENAGVESFVHMSTAVVHGHGHAGTLTETAPFRPDTEYGELKLNEEEIVADYSGTVQPAIIRPMIVFGPYSYWVTDAVDRVREGAVLADGGTGTLDQIYIDNLVDMVLQALRREEANGEAFLAVDDSQVDWQTYYSDIADLIGDHPPIQSMSSAEIKAKKAGRLVKHSVVPPARIPVTLATSGELQSTVVAELSHTPWAEPLLKLLPAQLRERLLPDSETEDPFRELTADEDFSSESRSTAGYELPSDRMIDMQANSGSISNEKAKDLLGWEQRVSYDEAMSLISSWLEYEQIV